MLNLHRASCSSMVFVFVFIGSPLLGSTQRHAILSLTLHVACFLDEVQTPSIRHTAGSFRRLVLRRRRRRRRHLLLPAVIFMLSPERRR